MGVMKDLAQARYVEANKRASELRHARNLAEQLYNSLAVRYAEAWEARQAAHAAWVEAVD